MTMKNTYLILAAFLLSFSAFAQAPADSDLLALADEPIAIGQLEEFPLVDEALEEGAGTMEFYREVVVNVTEPPVYIESEYPVVAAGMEGLEAELSPSGDSLAVEGKDTLQIEEQLQVIEAAACRDIENHRPVESGTHFSSLNRKIWVYSRVKMPAGESAKISHVYYLNGKKIQTVELAVKGPTFRTRSYKSINQMLDGNWKVEIRSESGALLDTVEFEVYAECP